MRRLLLVALTVGSLLALSTAAGAQAVSTPFTSQIEIDDVVEGTTRITPGGVLLVRGEVSIGTEDITMGGEFYPGDLVMTNNVNLNLNTLRGTLSGTFELDVPGLDRWTGTARGVIRDGLVSGTFVGHGDHGTKQMGTFVELPSGVLDVEGVILYPPGRTG